MRAIFPVRATAAPATRWTRRRATARGDLSSTTPRRTKTTRCLRSTANIWGEGAARFDTADTHGTVTNRIALAARREIPPRRIFFKSPRALSSSSTHSFRRNIRADGCCPPNSRSSSYWHCHTARRSPYPFGHG